MYAEFLLTVDCCGLPWAAFVSTAATWRVWTAASADRTFQDARTIVQRRAWSGISYKRRPLGEGGEH